MNKYRPTTLRLACKNCPQAVDYYEQKRPYFRDHYQVGIAAHAVLEALGHAAVQWRKEGACLPPSERENIAHGIVKRLITKGRTFDGSKEPPISPDAAIEGRELALRWVNSNPLSDTARYELGAGFTRDWEPVGYDDPRARFRLIFDVLDVVEESTEESGTKGILVRDYKTAWSADASELDSLQMKAQAVCAVALMCRSLTFTDYSFVRQEIVNLRTSQVYSRTLWLDGMGDGSEENGAALLAGWQRDLTMAMDALDEMRKDAQSRPANPGIGCCSCPWITSCDTIKPFLAEVRINPNPVRIAEGIMLAKALAEELTTVARHQLDESAPISADGHQVGYFASSRRVPREDAAVHLLDAWTAKGGDARGLLKAMAPGVGAIESAAKVLLPGKENSQERGALVESLTQPKIGKTFGILKTP